jgi:hypothetical protein
MPEFLFRPTYDEKHRAFSVRKGEAVAGPVQRGLTERLLCFECEQRISRYERYFSQIWFGQLLPLEVPPDGMTLSNLSYVNFKLFHLSILWRASVSGLSAFSQIKLDAHEDVMRNMLCSEDPGAEDEYRIMGSILFDPATHHAFDSIIATPDTAMLQGDEVALAVFGGCAWIYVLSASPDFVFAKAALSAEGTLYLPAIPFSNFSTVADLYSKIRATRLERYGP